jgi:hypothetical protein
MIASPGQFGDNKNGPEIEEAHYTPKFAEDTNGAGLHVARSFGGRRRGVGSKIRKRGTAL